MTFDPRRRVAGGSLLGLALVTIGAVGCMGEAPPRAEWEELDRLRTVGLAYLEEERAADAAAAFARLAELAPEEPLGPADLAVARLRQGDLEAARRAAGEAVGRGPADPEVRVIAAAVMAEAGYEAEAEIHLLAALESDSMHVPALWALHELTEATAPLETLLRATPGNLPALLTAAELRVRADDLDAAAAALERIEQLIAAGKSEAREQLRASLHATSRGERAAALRRVRVLHNVLRVDPLYTRGLTELTGRPGSRAEPLRRFRTIDRSPEPIIADGFALRFERSGGVRTGDGREADSLAWTAGVVTDVDADSDLDLVVSLGEGLRCLANRERSLRVTECMSAPEGWGVPAQAADFDGDARADLLLVGASGVRILVADSAGFRAGPVLQRSAGARTALAADFDHDGDLDVLAGGPGPARFYRQSTPGRFEERAGEAGLAGVVGLRAGAFGDLDLDGDLDLVLSTDAGLRRFDNQRHGVFEAVDDGLSTADGEIPPGAPAIVDVNGDGWFDVLIGTHEGLYLAAGDGSGDLEPPVRVGSDAAGTSSNTGDTTSLPEPRIIVEDFDLDGFIDVLVASAAPPTSVRIYRGTGTGSFVDASGALPATLRDGGGPVHAVDVDGDDDLDLVSGADGGMYLNRGGEANHALEVSLLALAAGSGKVNRFGIGSRLDVWAGGRRQSRVVRGEVERFGLGLRERADVVRIEWTNGVPQNVFDPSSDERLVERQVLKGSCAFVYAWAGESFEFVTDFMWKSALGMPLGIMAGEIAYAPPDPSLEYVRIPPGALVPRGGFHELRITEELWEVAYLDDLALLAVDHPAGWQVYVNEAFAEPTAPNDHLYPVSRVRAPETAIDHRGIDVVDRLARRDFDFVGGFDRGPVQGVTAPHTLTLTLAEAAGRPATLFLAGWVHPTDASINVRMGQMDRPAVMRPRAEVPDGAGGWRTLDAKLDFPAGKNKTVVVELPDGLPEADPRIRLRTNMEIYWDAAFYTVGDAGHGTEGPGELVRQVVEPADAELRERGFSRMYRRGGRYGPHWFDYDDLRRVSPWRPFPGRYTRAGNVLELLTEADDRYVIFGPGDEIAVRFPVQAPPPTGFERTFFLYSDGFLKDADLNTRLGDRVSPLPRHGQAAYGGAEPDAEMEVFAERYLTRVRGPAGPPGRPER